MTPIPVIGLYAFWKNSTFPFVLGGVIVKMHEDGRVETEGYGPGFLFKPIKILPRDAGVALMQELQKVVQCHANNVKGELERATKEVRQLLCMEDTP